MKKDIKYLNHKNYFSRCGKNGFVLNINAQLYPKLILTGDYGRNVKVENNLQVAKI